jgi:glutathione peroxidase
MLKIIVGLLLIIVTGSFAISYGSGIEENSTFAESAKPKSIYEFPLKDIDGKDVRLKKYKGNVLLIVNTASKCGYTPQYEGLQKIHEKYNAQKFYVLGFPANNFSEQEPGTEKEIKEFCESKYKVTFPMFAKISVKGADQNPLYKFLTGKKTNPAFAGDISWNFNKFLINKKGQIVARFSSKDKPDSEVVMQAIEKYLKEK